MNIQRWEFIILKIRKFHKRSGMQIGKVRSESDKLIASSPESWNRVDKFVGMIVHRATTELTSQQKGKHV